MKYKNLAILNIVSILLILLSARIYISANTGDKALDKQYELIQQTKDIVNLDCTADKMKKQLIKVANSSYEAQYAANHAYFTTARALLLLGVLNIVITIISVRKCRV